MPSGHPGIYTSLTDVTFPFGLMSDGVAPCTQSRLRSPLAQPKGPEMQRSGFTQDPIPGILKQHEAGISVADLCRKHGAISFALQTAL